MFRVWGILLNNNSRGYPAFSQTNKVESLLKIESQEIAENSKKALQETKQNNEKFIFVSLFLCFCWFSFYIFF